MYNGTCRLSLLYAWYISDRVHPRNKAASIGEKLSVPLVSVRYHSAAVSGLSGIFHGAIERGMYVSLLLVYEE